MRILREWNGSIRTCWAGFGCRWKRVTQKGPPRSWISPYPTRFLLIARRSSFSHGVRSADRLIFRLRDRIADPRSRHLCCCRCHCRWAARAGLARHAEHVGRKQTTRLRRLTRRKDDGAIRRAEQHKRAGPRTCPSCLGEGYFAATGSCFVALACSLRAAALSVASQVKSGSLMRPKWP